MKLELEPGWRLMRRQFGGRSLGHVYVYSDSAPSATAAQPSSAQPGTQPGAAQPPAP
jgi:hypothetical protein